MLIRGFRALVALLAFSVVTACTAAEQPRFEAGKHYQVLPYPVRTSDLSKIEVVELFWYGCPHCYHFKPLLEAWEKTLPKDVNMVLIPAVLGDSWEPAARAFYAAEALGVLNNIHTPMYEALARDHKPLNDVNSMATFVATLGVNEADFRKAYDSFAVNSRVDSAVSKVKGYRLTGVPALVVNGKYRISASDAGSPEAMLQVADFLIEQERQATKAN